MALLNYEKWLIGDEVQERCRTEYLRIAQLVIDQLPGDPPTDEVEMRARVASLTQEELLNIKEAVGWTTMDGRRKKQNSASTSCTEINVFLKWAGCPNRVKVPRKVQVVRIPLTQDESERLLKAAGKNRNKVLAARNKAIMVMLQEGAFRRGAVNVRREDMRLDEGFVVIRATKNEDDWKINLPSLAVEIVRDYLDVRLEGKDEEAERWLFTSQWKTALSDEQVYKIVKQAAVNAGIERNIWPHLLRTTKLTSMAKQGVNPFDIKDHACQRNIQSLQPYMRMGDEEQHDRIVGAALFRHTDVGSGPVVRIIDGDDGNYAKILAVKLALGEISEESYNRASIALGPAEKQVVVRK